MDDLDDIKIEITEAPKPIPESVYLVKITNVKKLEPRLNPFNQETEVRLGFEFTILEGSQKGKKVFAYVRTKLSTEPKPSNLYKIWAASEGRTIKKEEFDTLHVSKLIGKTLRILVNQVEKGDRIYNNIESYVKTEKEDLDEEEISEDEESETRDKDIKEVFGEKPVRRN